MLSLPFPSVYILKPDVIRLYWPFLCAQDAVDLSPLRYISTFYYTYSSILNVEYVESTDNYTLMRTIAPDMAKSP